MSSTARAVAPAATGSTVAAQRLPSSRARRWPILPKPTTRYFIGPSRPGRRPFERVELVIHLGHQHGRIAGSLAGQRGRQAAQDAGDDDAARLGQGERRHGQERIARADGVHEISDEAVYDEEFEWHPARTAIGEDPALAQ